MTGLELGSPKSSVLGSIYSCSDLGTGARNRVSSGRKRRFPSRGTDKDLINRSNSRPFWRSARTLRSWIAVGGREKGRGLSLTLNLRPQLPLPRHCGTPRPEMANGVLPRPADLGPRRSQRARAPGGLGAALESSVFEGQRSREGILRFQRILQAQYSLPITMIEQSKNKVIVSSEAREGTYCTFYNCDAYRRLLQSRRWGLTAVLTDV